MSRRNNTDYSQFGQGEVNLFGNTVLDPSVADDLVTDNSGQDSPVLESVLDEDFTSSSIAPNISSPTRWQMDSAIIGTTKHIFVAGVNYDNKNADSFIVQLNNYKARVSSTDQTFIIIDLHKGTIITQLNGRTIATNRYLPINSANYPTPKHFDALGKTNYIGKKTIYNMVEEIGINDPGTLEQVCIFSHAFSDGPILVNSDEGDPLDLDFRISDTENAGIFDFKNFKNAFNNVGLFKIFGCQSNPPLNYLLKRIMQNPKYSDSGATQDYDEFVVNDIKIPYPHGNGFYELVSYNIDKIGANLYTKLNGGKIKLTFLQVKKIFAYKYLSNYATYLTYNTKTTSQYSLPATYALFSQPSIFRVSEDTKNNTNFFKTYLNVKIGESFYGIYDEATISNLFKII